MAQNPARTGSRGISMMTVSTLSSSSLSLTFSFRTYLSSRRISQHSCLAIENRCSKSQLPPTITQSLDAKPNVGSVPFPGKFLGFWGDRKGGFCLNAEKRDSVSSGGGGIDDAERLARGDSTMPERFRYLTKKAPDPPVRWPWFVALASLAYAWRAVLFELSNWKKAALAIVGFVGYLLKLALAIVFQFIGDPITSLIGCIETAIYSIRAFYSGVVAYAPIPELTTVIVLTSAVLAVGEAVAPNSITSQPYVLTLTGLVSYAAVISYISEPFFWTLLVGLYGFSRIVKKRDNVTSALPVAAALAAVGEPWVRVLAMVSYAALVIFQNSKKVSEGSQGAEVAKSQRRVPTPLLAAALAIGVRLAAKWAGYRHLTWMIV